MDVRNIAERTLVKNTVRYFDTISYLYHEWELSTYFIKGS